jgi:hypothetical protein
MPPRPIRVNIQVAGSGTGVSELSEADVKVTPSGSVRPKGSSMLALPGGGQSVAVVHTDTPAYPIAFSAGCSFLAF